MIHFSLSLSLPLSSPSLLLSFVTAHPFFSCCNSTISSNVLSSCTNPLYNYLNFGQPTRSQFCPSPPKLSYSAASSMPQPSGPLDSQNVYVAELLLELATDLTPDIFFRRFQAGFSLTTREPRHSVCGCTQPNDVCEGTSYFTALNTMDNGTNGMSDITRYSFNQICAGAWGFFGADMRCNSSLNTARAIPGCLGLNFMEGTRLECNSSTTPLSSFYQVDGLASNILQVCTLLIITVVHKS